MALQLGLRGGLGPTPSGDIMDFQWPALLLLASFLVKPGVSLPYPRNPFGFEKDNLQSLRRDNRAEPLGLELAEIGRIEETGEAARLQTLLNVAVTQLLREVGHRRNQSRGFLNRRRPSGGQLKRRLTRLRNYGVKGDLIPFPRTG